MEHQHTDTTVTSPTLKLDNFEQITRWMRWFVIVAVLISFPLVTPQVYYLYGLAALAIIYNLTRYVPLFMRSRWYSSTALMLVIDNIFLVALVALAGHVITPFTGFLAYTIITASYRYKIVGTLLVITFQLAFLSILMSMNFFQPITLSNWQLTIVIAAISLGIGIFVEQLTRLERDEKSILERLSHELAAGQKHLMSLIDSLDDAIFVVDRSGKIQEYNTAAMGFAQLDGELKGKQFSQVMPLRLRTNPDARVVDILQEAGPQRRRDLIIRAANGAVSELDVTVSPVRLEDTNTTDYIIVCKDITRERSIGEERSDFISVVSHELRTPISIMEGSLSVVNLKKDKFDPPTRDLLKQAHDQSLQLGNIIKDLSMMAEANNDNLPVKLEPIDPAALVEQMAHEFEAQAKQKGLEIASEVDGKIPSVISTKSHIVEVLQNYMTNAIKYSNEGQIVLKAEPSKIDGVIFSVTDSGIGISPADQKHLFKKFFRAEDFRTRQTGGTGLGLYLCRELAQRMGGRVWFQSELNKGSTFFLEIPPANRLRHDQKEVVEAEVANLVDSI